MMPFITTCPRCGGEGEVKMLLCGDCRQWKYFVRCRFLACSYDGPLRKTSKEAIAAWNQRKEW